MPHSAYYHRKIVKKQIRSSHLDAERNIWVYLPPGYNELLSYPLVLCQDGLEFLNYGRIATLTNQLVLEEDLEPPIIVGIEVDLDRRTEEYSPDGARYPMYRQFVVDEVLPWIEEEFPVRRESESRILAGDSLGATVSLHLALDYPQLFHRVLSMSGAFREPTQQRLRDEPDLSGLDLYMLIGLQEQEVETKWGREDFLGLNRSARDLLRQKGCEPAYKEADGPHTWGLWQKELPDAMRYFFGG